MVDYFLKKYFFHSAIVTIQFYNTVKLLEYHSRVCRFPDDIQDKENSPTRAVSSDRCVSLDWIMIQENNKKY